MVTVCTIVAGRPGHLTRLIQGLTESLHLPDELVIIFMGAIPQTFEKKLNLPFKTLVHSVALRENELPLAQARNFAASVASNELLIFLDVDCIPSKELVQNHLEALNQKDQLWMGTVRYLKQYLPSGQVDELLLYSLSEYNKLQPVLPSGNTQQCDDYCLFWSLNFSISKQLYLALGGFDEEFYGYGGEDTDFALVAEKADSGFGHVGALAFHQYHESESPPLSHLGSIVRNSNYFKAKHGYLPMEKWLREFEDRKLISIDDNDRVSLAIY